MGILCDYYGCIMLLYYIIDIDTGNFIPRKVIFIAANIGMGILYYIDTTIYR